MEYSDWKHVQRDGTIPEDLLPCEGFQLEWFLEWELDPVAEGGFTTHKGTWRWKLERPTGGTALFESLVSIYGTAVWFPGGELISWYIQTNRNNPVINTTVPVRPPMLGVPSDAESWWQRSDGSWANEAEAGYILEWGWVPGAGVISFPVYVTYQSAIYLIPLETDAKLKVPFHNIGAFQLPKMVNVRIRTLGSGVIGSLYDQAGFVRLAVPQSSDLHQLESPDGGATFKRMPIVPGLTSPVLFKDDHNRLYCSGWRGVSYYILISVDDGRRWEVFQTNIWPQEYSDIDGTALHDGVIVYMAKKGTDLWCKTSADQFQSTRKIGTHAGGIYRIARGTPLSGELVISNGQNSTFQSTDGGMTWSEAGVVVY